MAGCVRCPAMRRTSALLVLVALTIGACGGGGGGSSTKYCDQLRKTAKEAADRQKASAGGTTTSINYGAIRTQFDQGVDKLLAAAPAELKDDYKVFKDYFD